MKVENLSKTYRTKGAPPVQALKGVSFTLPDTGMVFLLGRSGSGKSTLLHILSGLESFDAGDITYRGNRFADFSECDRDKYRNSCCGIIFQDYSLITELTVGTKSRTNVSLVWLEGVTPRRIVTQLERRLRGLDVESFVTPAAVEEAVTGSRCSPFPLLRFTERPDKFAQALLEGQAGLLVDGLPLGYLAPVELGGFLTSPEDQGMDFVTASCIRVIRYGALLVSLLLPALYAAMAAFHQEMLPTQLLLSIIESKQQVPFPTMLEVIGLLIAFEILQEAGVHLPQSLGQAVSIIGGLVVGSAAVEAKLISPAALIVVAVAGVCGYVIPGRELANAVRVWRFILTLCAALAGLFGVSVGLIALLLHLGGLETFGLSYLRPFDRAASDGMVLRRRLKTQAARRKQEQEKQENRRSL